MRDFLKGLGKLLLDELAKASALLLASFVIGFGLGGGLIAAAWWMLR